MRSEKSMPVTRAPRSWSFLDKYPVPQPASSTVRPWTSSANAHNTGSEFRMRLPSPSSPTCIRQSSATRFHNSRTSSSSPSLIALSPARTLSPPYQPLLCLRFHVPVRLGLTNDREAHLFVECDRWIDLHDPEPHQLPFPERFILETTEKVCADATALVLG